MFKTPFFLFLILFSASSASAQFNTVLPKEKPIPVQPQIVTSENITSNIDQSNIRITATTTNIEEEFPELEKFRQRKYLALPIDSLVITSEYGYRNDPFTGKRKFHKGIDFAADYNYVYSIMPGKIVKSGKNKGFGNFVEIEHGDFRTIYAHLYQTLVDVKQKVEAGEPIGISGSTGRSTGEHLHFQMFHKDQTIDPKPILNFIQSLSSFTKNEFSTMIEETINKAKTKEK